MSRPVKHYGKWRIRWIDEHGDRKSEVYDRFEDAAYKLRQYETAVEEVRRGLRLPTPSAKTFGELCDYWIANRAARKRSRKDDVSIIERHLRPVFGKLLLKNLNVQAVDCFVAEREYLNPKTVHNHLTLLKTMLKLARRLRWLAELPDFDKPRIAFDFKNFRYLRTEEEVARFLRAAADEGPDVHALYSTAVYTGLRAGELAGLRWDDVDFDRRLIAVQRSFDGPTKSGKTRHVPILDVLLPVLRSWRLARPGRLVFPNHADEMQHPGARVFDDVLRRVLARGGFPLVEVDGKTRGYIRFHDLRHTFASHWVMRGGDIFKLQKILGHQSMSMTQRYAHLAPEVFAEDLGRFGVGESPLDAASVVPLRSARPT